uniref:Uncharacterized protein AlNc14C152G7550 n=1 Tax=Albugo laibachii Nc14 TaxID=890382 RepID=F0WM39_9STRA|nr:conserved hypothetical protein [Albugo laibachii Nc14]|eukprot:CCA22367.1 conserved hypothetical protein [Albugo laibachii Nc14]
MHMVRPELIHLISLSRHGSRAPNPTVQHLCPNNMQNYQKYHIPPEQLTERGMEQLQQAGEHIRDIYVKRKRFLNVSFNGPNHQHFETYFRADAATRCGQSAAALGYGLYPDGSGPGGFKKQIVPIFMQLSENEHDFGAGGPCWQVSNEHLTKYAGTRGRDLILKHRTLLQLVASICGEEFYLFKDPIMAIKDVADMFLFDINQGLPLLPGMNEDLLFELGRLSFQHMIERLYATSREITYACGGFPILLLKDLLRAAKSDSENQTAATSYKYHSYHGHRELLHGLGFMLGLKFHFDGLPSFNGSTPLIPGTTLLIELHKKTMEEERVQWLHHQDLEASENIRFSQDQTDGNNTNLIGNPRKRPPKISQETMNTSSADENLRLEDLRLSMSDSVIAQIHTAREYDLCTVMKGWMEKCSQQLKTWNWQYFVLRDDGVLSFYLDEGMKKLKGTLNVGHGSGAQVSVQLNLTEKKQVFLLSTSLRATLFSAPSRKLMSQWISRLRSVGVDIVDQIDPLRSTIPFFIRDKDTPHQWQHLRQSDDLTRRDGFLWKRGHLKKNWKKRYFRIEDGQLQYFTENKKLMRGAIPLNGTVVSPGMTCCPDGRKNYFVISNMNHKSELHLNAETEAEMHEWVQVLQQAQSGFERKKRIEEPLGFALVVKRAEEIPIISFYATYSKSNEIDVVMERKTEAVVVTACPGKSIPIGSQLVGVNDKNILPLTYVESRDLLQTSAFPLTLYFIAPPFKLGSMIKKSRSGLENWKERVLVVSNGEIRYYKRNQKGTRETCLDVTTLKPRKAFALYGCYMNLIDVPDRPHCIVIVRSPSDKLVLQAPNLEECMEWASLIYCSIRIASQGITPGHSTNLQLERLLDVSMEDTSRCSLQSNSTIEV